MREYAPDDDVRQINWRATARLGRPMSNQYRIDQDREVRCLLDAGRLSAAACAGGTLLDVALDGLIAVCATADALGDRSGAMAFADRVLRDVAPSRLGAAAVARSLFDVEPVDADSDYELAFRSVAGGKRGFVLVLADLVDEAAARALVDAVPVLARRHAVCVASVRDDALDGLLRPAAGRPARRLRHDGRARDAAGARARGAARRAPPAPPSSRRAPSASPAPASARTRGRRRAAERNSPSIGRVREEARDGDRPRVVVVGGGFAGLQAVRKLRRAPVEVTLIDRRNFHLFQPLAYQVATGALSPAEICSPLRSIFRRQRNARILLAEVAGFDLERREVILDGLPNGGPREAIPYDTLVVGGGSRYSYFGHDEWQPFAPELKSLEGALEIRRRILTAFEAAEVEPDDARRQAWLTFVVVGGGPTGVEMAGQIAELAHDTLRRDFRSIDTRATRVLLVESTDHMLPAFPASLSRKAAQALERAGCDAADGQHRRRHRPRQPSRSRAQAGTAATSRRTP